MDAEQGDAPRPAREADERTPPSGLAKVVLEDFGPKNAYKVLPKSSTELFGAELGAIFDDISIQHGAHPMMTSFFVLPMLSAMCGPELLVKPSVDIPGWNERVLIWSAAVAMPGSAKTPVQNACLVALSLVQFAVNQLAARRGSQRVTLVGTSKTLEHLADSLRGSADKVAVFVVDELAGFLASIGQYKSSSGADADMAIVLELRNGGKINDSTIGRGTSSVNKTHVAICGGLQPATFKKLLASKAAYESGLAGRFAVGVMPPGEKSPEAVKALSDRAGSSAAVLQQFSKSKMQGMLALYDLQQLEDMQPMTVVAAGRGKNSRASIAAAVDDDVIVSDLPPVAQSMLQDYGDALDSKADKQSNSEWDANRLQKRQRLLPSPVKALALIMLDLFLSTREDNDKYFKPSIEVFVLGTAVDEKTRLSPYVAFDLLCQQIKEITQVMIDRGLEGPAGVLNKLPGQVLQLCGVLHPTSHIIKSMTEGVSSVATEIPSDIGMSTLISAMDFFRVSTLQRFMLLNDEASLACIRGLVPHVELVASPGVGAALAGRGDATEHTDEPVGEEKEGDDDAPPAPRPPAPCQPVWRKAVRLATVSNTGVKDAIQKMCSPKLLKVLFTEEYCAASGIPTDGQPLEKWEAAKYNFALTSSALTASKLLTSGPKHQCPVKALVENCFGGAGKAGPIIHRVANGLAGSVKNELFLKFSDRLAADEIFEKELHLDELDLPGLSDIIHFRNVEGIKVPMKYVPLKRDVDPRMEYDDYMAFKRKLAVYGILLEEWSELAANRFRLVEQRYKAAQDEASRLLQQAVSENMALEQAGGSTGRVSLGGVTIMRGDRGGVRGSLSGLVGAGTPRVLRQAQASGAAFGSPQGTPGVESAAVAEAHQVAGDFCAGMNSP